MSDQSRKQQQPDQPTQGVNFKAIAPSTGAVDDNPPHDGTDSAIARQRATSDFDLDTATETAYTPSHSSVSSPDREGASLNISEHLEALCLAQDQSTETYVNMSHAIPEDTNTSEQYASSIGSFPNIEQLDINEEHMSVGSGDEVDSDISSLYDEEQGPPLPEAPIYNSRLQSALREVKEHLSSIRSDMKRSPLIPDHGSDFYKQYEQMCMLNQLDCPETRTVGFIGNSGVGKSTLINSLLDLDGLARSVRLLF